jgi:hypothetical protein
MPRRTATSDSQPPIGKPMMPAPALNAAISAERPNDECAASATIDTDQNEKNHRFHSTAMNAKLMSSRSRERRTGPSSELAREDANRERERQRDLEDGDPDVREPRRVADE